MKITITLPKIELVTEMIHEPTIYNGRFLQ